MTSTTKITEREREREMRTAQNEVSNAFVNLFMGAMQKMTETMEMMLQISDPVVNSKHHHISFWIRCFILLSFFDNFQFLCF